MTWDHVYQDPAVVYIRFTTPSCNWLKKNATIFYMVFIFITSPGIKLITLWFSNIRFLSGCSKSPSKEKSFIILIYFVHTLFILFHFLLYLGMIFHSLVFIFSPISNCLLSPYKRLHWFGAGKPFSSGHWQCIYVGLEEGWPKSMPQLLLQQFYQRKKSE